MIAYDGDYRKMFDVKLGKINILLSFLKMELLFLDFVIFIEPNFEVNSGYAFWILCAD